MVENVRTSVNDGDGRVLGITFEHLGRECRLLNVYAPNDEKERRDLLGCLGDYVARTVLWWETSMCGVCGRLDVSVCMSFRSDSSMGGVERCDE